jgi:hypothetical protein
MTQSARPVIETLLDPLVTKAAVMAFSGTLANFLG